MKAALCVFLMVLLIGFKPTTNLVNISGHLETNPKRAAVDLIAVQVLVKSGKEVLATSFTDEKGDFDLTVAVYPNQQLDFFCCASGLDTLLIGSMQTTTSNRVEKTFYVPVQVDKNLFGRAQCPKCKKNNRVYEIAYGDGIPIGMNVSKNGDTTYTNIVRGHTRPVLVL